MKRLLVFLLVLFLAAVHVACGNSYKSPTSPNMPTTPAPGQPTPTPGRGY